MGIEPGLVVANLVIPPEQATTPFAQARRAMQERTWPRSPQRFPVPVLQIPLLPAEVKGLDVLTELGERIYWRRQQYRAWRAGRRGSLDKHDVSMDISRLLGVDFGALIGRSSC